MTPQCQVCASPLQDPLLDLGYQPLCNQMIQEPGEPQTFYPLSLHRCPSCDLVQLGHVLPTERLFGEQYTYLTGSSPGAVTYFENLAKRLIKAHDIVPGDVVVDIGSNDGTFLRAFQERGCNVLGLEGAIHPAIQAQEAEIPTLPYFLDTDVAAEVLKRVGKPIKLVTAMNVLAHCDDVNEVLRAFRILVTPETTLVVQNHWLHALLGRVAFDTIYHEHLRYFSLQSLTTLLARWHLRVYDAEEVDYYGGSLLVTAVKSTWANAFTPSATAIAKREKGIGLWEKFAGLETRMLLNRIAIQEALVNAHLNGERVIGIGAPMKATTLLNYHGVGPDLMEFVTETNPLKIGHAIPGVGIPIVDEASVDLSTVGLAVILTWNWADALMAKYRAMGYQGRFLIPNPDVRVVE